MKKLLIFTVLAMIAILNFACEKNNGGEEIITPKTEVTLLKKIISNVHAPDGTEQEIFTADFIYDDKNRVIEVRDTYKGVSTFSYDNNNRLSGMFRNQRLYKYTYKKDTVLIDNVPEYLLDDKGNVRSFDYCVGTVCNTIYQLDSKGNNIKYGQTTYQYDNKKHPLSQIGARIDYNYTDMYAPRIVTFVNNQVSCSSHSNVNYQYTYNDDGFPKTLIVDSELSLTFEYVKK